MIPKDNRFTKFISLSKQAYGKYKLQILVLIILSLVSGFFEGIGVNALIPLFTLVLKGAGTSNDRISHLIQGIFSFFHLTFSIKYLIIFIAILFISKALVTLIINYIKIRIAFDYEQKTKNSLFGKILAANWVHLMKQKLGHLETVLMIDVTEASGLLQEISGAIIIFVSLLVYIIVAMNISLVITLIVLALGGIIFLISKPLNYKIKSIGYKKVSLNRDIAHHISENIVGIKTIKSMFVSEGVAERGNWLFAQVKKIAIKVAFLKSLMGALFQPISVVVICFIFALSYKTGQFNLPSLVAIVYLVDRIFIYIQQLQRSLHSFISSLPHVESVLNFEKEAIKHTEENLGKLHFAFNKSLEFKNVNFVYDTGRQVLSKLNFKILKGEMVGLIGPSGVGKTTLVDLILRLLTPSNGQIVLDGKNISDVNLKEWRENIGYVSQDIFLTNDTIAENIRFYNTSISDEEMITAAKMANIYDFVQNCPNKFETVIGERGIMLSVGQRQRIVIARILARKPSLLILDEATSALDNESEVQIHEVIRNLKGQITVLAIAHRLTTIQDSDKLIVLKDGMVFEEGDPKILLKDKDSYFFKVYNLREA